MIKGKRKKSSRGPVAKKKQVLDSNFMCLFCNHDNAVTTKIDKKLGIGSLSCRVCGQKFQCNINYLSHAVDVYAEWIDACEEVAKEDAEAKRTGVDNSQATYTASQAAAVSAPRASASQSRPARKEQNLEDFVVDDEGDMEDEYGD